MGLDDDFCSLAGSISNIFDIGLVLRQFASCEEDAGQFQPTDIYLQVAYLHNVQDFDGFLCCVVWAIEGLGQVLQVFQKGTELPVWPGRLGFVVGISRSSLVDS